MLKFKHIAKILLIPLLLVTTFSFMAAADITLRSDIRVAGPILTLGDLFSGAGEAADTAVAETPEPGKSRSIIVKNIVNAVNKAGLTWEKPAFLRAVRITREGQELTQADLGRIVRNMLASSLTNERFNVKFYGSRTLYIPLDNDFSDIEVSELAFNAQSGRFTARLALPIGMGEYKELSLSGNIEAVRALPVLNRAVAPGEIITRTDIAMKDVAVRKISRNFVSTVAEMIGKTVRNGQRAGAPLRTSDLISPVTVKRNKTIGISFSQGAISLMTIGKALENGGTGDIIRVLNIASNKTVHARIIGPDMAEIITPQMLARQLAENQYQ